VSEQIDALMIQVRVQPAEQRAQPLSRIVRLTLDDVNEGFALMERQDGIRSVLSFS